MELFLKEFMKEFLDEIKKRNWDIFGGISGRIYWRTSGGIPDKNLEGISRWNHGEIHIEIFGVFLKEFLDESLQTFLEVSLRKSRVEFLEESLIPWGTPWGTPGRVPGGIPVAFSGGICVWTQRDIPGGFSWRIFEGIHGRISRWMPEGIPETIYSYFRKNQIKSKNESATYVSQQVFSRFLLEILCVICDSGSRRPHYAFYPTLTCSTGILSVLSDHPLSVRRLQWHVPLHLGNLFVPISRTNITWY